MKEKYLKPQADIETFRCAEVISTSGNGDIRDDDNIVVWPWS